MSYELLVNDVATAFSRLSFRDELLLPFPFEVEVAQGTPLTEGDVVKIKRDGVLAFKGITTSKTRALTEVTRIVNGCDAGSIKLSRFLTELIVFDDVEPSQLVRFLDMPCRELGAGIIRDGFGSDYDWNYFSGFGGVWEQWPDLWVLKDTKRTLVDFLRSILYRTPAGDSQQNYRVVCKLKVRSCWYDNDTSDKEVCVGLAARITDANNFYVAYISYEAGTGDVLRIEKVVAGVRTELAEKKISWAFGETYTFTFITTGTSLVAYINEIPDARVTVTDSSFTQGKYGLVHGNSQTEFFGLKVLKIGTATASSSEAGSSPGGAIDGDLVTYWRAGGTEAWWLQYDLTEIKSNICAILVRLTLRTDDGDVKTIPEEHPDIKIQISTDGSAWTTISDDDCVNTRDLLKVFAPASVRYVKILTDIPSYGPRPNVKNIQIFEATEGGYLLALGTIHDYEDGIAFETQDEKRSEAIRRVAEMLGWNAWCDKDEKLNFVYEKGTLRRRRLFHATADVHVWKLGPNTNYGTDEQCIVRVTTTADHVYRSFYKFDVSSVPSTVILKLAQLWSNCRWKPDAAPFDVQVRRPDASWAEGTITWNNQPATTLLSTITNNGEFPSRLEIDVTSVVTAWVAGSQPNYGLMLRLVNEANDATRGFGWCSKDGGVPRSWSRSRMLTLLVDYVTSDKHETIKFEEGHAFQILDVDDEAYDLIWKARLLGWGEGIYQLAAEYSDSSIKTAYPNLAAEFSRTEKDIVDRYLLAALAKRIVETHKTPRKSIHVELSIDDYATGAWEAGDLVTITSPTVALSGALRVISVEREMGEEAEAVRFDATPHEQTHLIDPSSGLESWLIALRSRLKNVEKIDQTE